MFYQRQVITRDIDARMRAVYRLEFDLYDCLPDSRDGSIVSRRL